MKSYLDLAYLDLGMLYKTKSRADDAKRNIVEAINMFEKCEAIGYLKQAKVALESLNDADM